MTIVNIGGEYKQMSNENGKRWSAFGRRVWDVITVTVGVLFFVGAFAFLQVFQESSTVEKKGNSSVNLASIKKEVNLLYQKDSVTFEETRNTYRKIRSSEGELTKNAKTDAEKTRIQLDILSLKHDLDMLQKELIQKKESVREKGKEGGENEK